MSKQRRQNKARKVQQTTVYTLLQPSHHYPMSIYTVQDRQYYETRYVMYNLNAQFSRLYTKMTGDEVADKRYVQSYEGGPRHIPVIIASEQMMSA